MYLYFIACYGYCLQVTVVQNDTSSNIYKKKIDYFYYYYITLLLVSRHTDTPNCKRHLPLAADMLCVHILTLCTISAIFSGEVVCFCHFETHNVMGSKIMISNITQSASSDIYIMPLHLYQQHQHMQLVPTSSVHSLLYLSKQNGAQSVTPSAGMRTESGVVEVGGVLHC